jgi:phytoene synthase
MQRGSSRRRRRSAIAEPTLPADPERALTLAYAPRAVRPALSLLWRLDEQLGAVVARGGDPAVVQMRLTWWHDALQNLEHSRPVDPLLIDLAETPRIDPHSLLPLIDGWEALLDPLPLSDEALTLHAEARGACLFRAAARLLRSDEEPAAAAGRLWSLVDLAFRISDRTTAERALSLALPVERRLPPALAPLPALAARDIRRGLDRPRRQGSPARVLRAMAAALTGR